MDFEDIPAAEEDSYVVPDAPPAVPMSLPEPEAMVPYHEEAVVPVEDALTIFNREFQVKIDAKRAAEFEHEKAVRAKALEEMATWKNQREIKLNAKKETNRNEQQVFVETLESEAQNLKVWDRVGKLIDANESGDRKGSDVSRMRKLFIQLKNEPLEMTRLAAGAN